VTHLYALPGLDGAITADAPTVEQCPDDETYTVTLDVSGQVSLLALFDGINRAGEHAMECLRILLWNKSSHDLRLSAQRDLRKIAEVRNALTLTLQPSQADELAAALELAATEPARCRWRDGCELFVNDPRLSLCDMHAAWNDRDGA